jgi:hypothetical protein
MPRRFVIEAVMLAVYGQLLAPSRPVEYVIPLSTLSELYDFRDSDEPVVPESNEDQHVKKIIREWIAFFEEPLNRKKLERIQTIPWRKSLPLLVNEKVTLTIIHAMDYAPYGETFDPVESELILTAQREQIPILTDQLEFMDLLIEAEVPVQVYDIEDFEFAVEGGISAEDWGVH